MKNIKLFITDLDGTFASSKITFGTEGVVRQYDNADLFSVAMLKRVGVKMVILTHSDFGTDIERLQKVLNIDIRTSCNNKAAKLEELCKTYNVGPSEVCYIGDDLNDLAIMRLVGYACCPKNAIKEVKKLSKFRSSKLGGNGAFRECVDKYFEINNIEKEVK